MIRILELKSTIFERRTTTISQWQRRCTVQRMNRWLAACACDQISFERKGQRKKPTKRKIKCKNVVAMAMRRAWNNVACNSIKTSPVNRRTRMRRMKNEKTKNKIDKCDCCSCCRRRCTGFTGPRKSQQRCVLFIHNISLFGGFCVCVHRPGCAANTSLVLVN